MFLRAQGVPPPRQKEREIRRIRTREDPQTVPRGEETTCIQMLAPVAILISRRMKPRQPSEGKTRLPASMATPVAIDLFCGAGGVTEGLKQAGFQVVGAVDVEATAVDTYRTNHPTVALWKRDICRLPVSTLMTRLRLVRGQLDLLAGCPPCQGFSTMRTHNRGSCVPDKRNELIFEFLRFVRVLYPKFVMLENVPGLSSDKRINRVCSELARLGYSHEKKIVDAADYGVPQRRRRFILVASRIGVLPLPKPRGRKETVRTAIGSLPCPRDSDDVLHNTTEHRAPHVVDLIRNIPRDGGSRSALPAKSQLPCHAKIRGFHDVYGRMAWDKVAPTITSGCTNPSKGRFLHPTQDRAITLREAAILQTFPRGYFFSVERGKEGAARLIGNALPPRMIREFAAAIRTRLLAANALDQAVDT
jgi:DNA (cytosine-5)-methyltransferase 1